VHGAGNRRRGRRRGEDEGEQKNEASHAGAAYRAGRPEYPQPA
jgi:hypothetical protein